MNSFDYDEWGQLCLYAEGKVADANVFATEFENDSGSRPYITRTLGSGSRGIHSSGMMLYDNNNRPLNVMCCMRGGGEGACGVGGDGDTEAPIPSGFPVLPCDAPLLPQTWADWEAEYTPMGQLATQDVTLTIGAVERLQEHRSEYDELGWLTSRSIDRDEWGGGVPAREFAYTPEIVSGKLTGKYTRIGPDGVETVTQLDVANRVQSIRRGPESAPLMRADYTYHSNDLVHTVTYGNGAVIEYTYDDANRLWTIEHRNGAGLTMLKLTYDYDRRDLPTLITEEHSDGSTVFVEFQHDNRGRLYHETRDGATPYDLWYAYDQGGNRLTKTDALNETETVYHYDLDDPDLYGSANNRLVYRETFDTSGAVPALLSTTWYYYNGVGNVTRVVTHPEGTEDYSATRLVYGVNGSTVSYVMGETWTWDGVSPCPDNYNITYAREFRYDGARQRYLNRELDADELQQYGLVICVSETWSDYDGDSMYGDFTVDGSTVTNITAFEPGIARSSAPGNPLATEYYHHDNLGTTRLLSDSVGTGMLQAAYTAFGELIAGEQHRYGYAGTWGYQAHDECPFLHVGHRYYEPATGRFLQRDPIGVVGQLNVYVYGRSRPTSLVDPHGLVPPEIGSANWPAPPKHPEARKAERPAQKATCLILAVWLTYGLFRTVFPLPDIDDAPPRPPSKPEPYPVAPHEPIGPDVPEPWYPRPDDHVVPSIPDELPPGPLPPYNPDDYEY